MSYIFESLGLCVKLTGSKLVEKVCSLLGVASVVRQKNDQVEEGGHFMLTMGEPREEFRGQQNLSVCLCVCVEGGILKSRPSYLAPLNLVHLAFRSWKETRLSC